MFLTILVALTGAINVAAFIGGAFDSRLDIISNASPALMTWGLILTLAAWRGGGVRVGALVFVLAAAPAAFVVTTDWAGALRASAARDGDALKVLSLNVWSSNLTPETVEELIRRENPDIVFLQEASSKRHRDLLARLADDYPVNVNVQAHCSTRVLTRFDLIGSVAGEDCAFVGARLALPAERGGGEIVAVSAHVPRDLDFDEPRALQTFAQFARASSIVGGDFNRTPWSWALRRFDNVEGLTRRTHAIATWPSPRRTGRWSSPIALLPIDHIYATPDWRTVSVRRAANAGSDHYGVVIELRRRP